MNDTNKCCIEPKPHLKGGLLSGIIYGLIPHSFCLAFALFSMIGAVTTSLFLKNILLIPNIFSYLVAVSIILATVSIFFYLKKTDCLCKSGIKSNWKYIAIVYITTVIVNMFFFYSVIPALANLGNNSNISQTNASEILLRVGIPCTGHSFLIIDELTKISGVYDATFSAPDIFKVTYNTDLVSIDKISSLEIFKSFKMTII